MKRQDREKYLTKCANKMYEVMFEDMHQKKGTFQSLNVMDKSDYLLKMSAINRLIIELESKKR